MDPQLVGDCANLGFQECVILRRLFGVGEHCGGEIYRHRGFSLVP